MNNVGTYYADLGQHKEAIELGMKAIELHRNALGDEHPQTLLLMENLSSRYSLAGRHIEGLELGLKAMKMRQKSMGTNTSTLPRGWIVCPISILKSEDMLRPLN